MSNGSNNRHNNLNKMISYLTKDNKKNLTEYILGYQKAKDILQQTGLPRHTFYTAINQIEPDIHEKRMQNKLLILHTIYQQLERSIPFEFIEFEIERLFGKNNNFKTHSLTKQRNAVINKLKINGFELDSKAIMTFKKAKTWYTRYCIKKDLLSNQASGYRIAKNYKVATSIVFKIKKQIHSTSPLLESIDLEQENKLTENIYIYNDFKNGGTFSELASKYGVDEWLIRIIVKYVEEVKDAVTIKSK